MIDYAHSWLQHCTECLEWNSSDPDFFGQNPYVMMEKIEYR
jgi:hypothetical protein